LRELGALYVTFSADSAKVITAGMQDTLGVWTWQHGDRTNHALSMPAVSGISRANIAIAVSPDGHYIAATHTMDRPDKTKPISQTNSSCRTVQIWDAKTEKPLVDLDGIPAWCNSGGIMFSHDSDLLFVIEHGQELCANRAAHVAVFSTKDWKRLWNICLQKSEPGQLAVSTDDKLIAIGGYHQVKVDQSARPDAPMFESHEVVAIVDIQTHQTIRVIDEALPDQFDIEALAWSPDGRRLAVGGGNRRGDSRADALKIYDPKSGAQVFTDNSEYSDVKGIAYTSDGKYFIEATINKQVRIWDGSHAHLLQSFPVGWGSVFENLFNALAVSPNNRYLAVTQQQGTTIYELK
jgi:WD40 repeat protein